MMSGLSLPEGGFYPSTEEGFVWQYGSDAQDSVDAESGQYHMSPGRETVPGSSFQTALRRTAFTATVGGEFLARMKQFHNENPSAPQSTEPTDRESS